MSTKFGKRAQRPPLSTLDKTIYTVILVLCVFSALLLLVFTRIHGRIILFADASVIAGESTFFSLFCILLIFYVSMTLIIVLGTAMQKRLPIFGNKKFKPKYFQAVLTVYPLFSKDFSKNFDEKSKRKLKITAIILVSVFVVFLVIFPFSIYPRQTLDENGTLRTYDSFNQITHTADKKSADHIVIGIGHSSGGKSSSPHWWVELSFVFEDETYCFSEGDFHEMTTEQALRYMLSVKEQFRGRYELYNTDDMDRLLKDGYTQTEISLIYELFD